MQQDIFDEDRTRREDNPPPWLPLETILSAWIRMIQVGKIQVVVGEPESDNEIYYPWSNLRFHDNQVQLAVREFSALIQAIESRLPASARREQASASDRGSLMDDMTLDAAKIPPSFAGELLRSCQRSKVSKIAPGLLLPNPSSHFLQQQRQFATAEDSDDPNHKMIPPVLLFSIEDTPQASTNPFRAPYDSIDFPACGLYISNADLKDQMIEESGIRLILPFGIGSNGHARKSDSERFDNNIDLYQPGFNTFSGSWTTCVRLERVLRSWRQMVESGKWTVGADGVEGGIEKFREADTQGKCEDYCLPVDW